MKYLCLIPARGGSKGIPRKNIRPLGGKPLIYYSFDIAVALKGDVTICVSTDDTEIASKTEEYGLVVPFLRPQNLASDSASSRDVIIHALEFYETQGALFDAIILLQPTSPFRKLIHVQQCIVLYDSEIDMVVSVNRSNANPYYNLFEENDKGFLVKSKSGNFIRRQDCPPVFEVNGAVYIINPTSLKQQNLGDFKSIKKYEMPKRYSLDIDEPFDWELAEFLIEKGLNS